MIKKKKTLPGKNHPSYIFRKEGDDYIFVGITHSDVTNINNKTVVNIKLEKNPNPNDKRPSYYIPVYGKENKNNFGRKLKNWSITKNDRKKIKKNYKK